MIHAMRLLLSAVLLASLAPSAQAETTRRYPIIPATPAPVVTYAAESAPMTYGTTLPDLLSFSAGYFDTFRNHPRDRAYDFRMDYKMGLSLLPEISAGLRSWDETIQLHPVLGLEATSDQALYAHAGFGLDVFLFDNLLLSPSVVVGLYHQGDGKDMGSVVEFRSTMELAYRFENESRIALGLGHMSNAGLSDTNPGAEIATLSLQVPASWIFSE